MTDRWEDEYKRMIHKYQERIRGKIRTNQDIRKIKLWIEDWLFNAECDLGNESYQILEKVFLEIAIDEDSAVFRELLKYSEDK